MSRSKTSFAKPDRRGSRSVRRIVSSAASLALLVTGLVVTGPSAAAAATPTDITGWGDNFYGQAPLAARISNAKALSAGHNYSLVLKKDGTVAGWGSNSNGKATPPSGRKNVVAIDAGDEHALAVTAAGKVVAWGHDADDKTKPPAALSNVTAVAAGFRHSLALTADGTVINWGHKIGNVPGAASFGVTAIAAGRDHSLALKNDGTVRAWGRSDENQTVVPAGLPKAKAIAAGKHFSMALTTDGKVVAWGSNSMGQTDVPKGLKDVVEIAEGREFGLALKSDGTVVAWGGTHVGTGDVPTWLTDVETIAAGAAHAIALVPEPVLQRTVTFRANGHGTAPAPQVVLIGDSASVPANPSASGYTFRGWFTAPGAPLSKRFSFDTRVMEDLTLYAGWASVDCRPFPDVTSANVHCRNIEWLSDQGITKPIGGRYKPADAVNRGSMVTFLYRLTHTNSGIPKCTTKPFPDVQVGSTHCGAIAWAVREKVTFGYKDGTYGAMEPVTRGSMATFLYRIANPGIPAPQCTSKPFDDVAVDYVHCGTIAWAKDHGITTGQADGKTYAPQKPVNRDQMASFLKRIYDYLN